MPERLRRSDRLLRVLEEYAKVVVVMHDTPDPDAIAAGWGLLALVRARLGKPVRLVGGGAIVRAENVHMVKLLRPPIDLVDEFTPEDDEAVVLVDCSPEGANQLCADGDARPVAVIDHHGIQGRQVRVRFRDVRPHAAASASIVAGYLREQRVEPSPELATALVYALRTEIIGTSVRYSRAERGIIGWIAKWVDYQALQDIQNAPLDRRYYEDYIRAIGATFLHEDVAVSVLGDAGSAEIVGEVADQLIRCTEIRRVLCGALVGERLVFSARTKAGGGNAVALIGSALRGVGRWGGHPNRAGGKVHGGEAGAPPTQSVIDGIRDRWLKACGVSGVRGTRLVPRRDILEVL